MRLVRKLAHLFSVALLSTLLIACLNQSEATLRERLLLRRQSESTSADSNRPESTTPASSNSQSQAAAASTQIPPRLYPDLPQFNPNYAQNSHFDTRPQAHFHNQAQTPFVPFGFQNGPNNRFVRPPPPMQPMLSPSERLQSQSFTSGLGKRLLSMIGIGEPVVSSNGTSTTSETQPALVGSSNARAAGAMMSPGEQTMRALQNSTVLQQLNRGVQSLYGGLSKMYNATVQQQLDLLQERFKRESENSTQAWQQRMAQQVPMFFKTMAMKVNDAQESLNRIMRQVSQQANNSANNNNNNNPLNQSQMAPQAPRDRSSFFDQFGNPINGDYDDSVPMFQPGQFLNHLGRAFGFGNPPMNEHDMVNGDRQQPRMDNFGGQLMNFWHNQVQPQISMMRGQLARVWRDLSNTGMMSMEPIIMRSRSQGAASSPANSSSSNLMEDILNGIDMNSAEYSLIEPKNVKPTESGLNDRQQQQQPPAGNTMGAQMQSNLMNMQREVNRIWNGLTISLQNALQNVKNQMNPPTRFTQMNMGGNNNSKQQLDVDPAENEIEGKVKELTKLQRDADTVADVVQQQQQAQQQRQTMGGRFRNFFNEMDFNGVQQLPNRLGESVSRFGAAIGDFWQQIPRRWDNFVSMRQPELMGSANNNINMNMGQTARLSAGSEPKQAQEQFLSSTAKP